RASTTKPMVTTIILSVWPTGFSTVFHTSFPHLLRSEPSRLHTLVVATTPRASRQELASHLGYGSLYRPELVIALVGSLKCGLDSVESTLAAQLSDMGYETETIIVSDLFRTLPGAFAKLPLRGSDEWAEDVRYSRFMDAGDTLRRIIERNDAAMFPILKHLRERRVQLGADQGYSEDETDRLLHGFAWIINSLKTPEEVLLLRRVYGGRFLCIAAHAPREHRRDALAAAIAQSHHRSKVDASRAAAEDLIFRDERGAETDPYGQNVAETFPLADMLIDSREEKSVRANLNRLLRIAFSHPYMTPTRDEHAMHAAWASSLRSSSLSRQVGAAITSSDGDLIAVGVNEVPRPFGGHYWESDSDIPDGRDFQNSDHMETATRLRNAVLGNTLEILMATGWIPPGEILEATTAEDLPKDADLRRRMASHALTWLLSPDASPETRRLVRSLLIQDLLEFFREVHAEMSALADAAKRGISVAGSSLFCTAFPCHECARVIVAAGIARVVFLEPYPKSLVQDLYRDSIAVDVSTSGSAHRRVSFDTFVGVSPRRFASFFLMLRRRDAAGHTVPWSTA